MVGTGARRAWALLRHAWFILVASAALFGGDFAAATTATVVQLHWVGPAVLAEPEMQQSAAPYFHSLWSEPEFQAAFTRRLGGAIHQLEAMRPDLAINTGELAVQGDDSYVLSLVLVRENVDTEIVDDVSSIAYEVQALAFVGNLSSDVQRRRVVTSYPVNIRYIDVAPNSTSVDAASTREVFRRLYLQPGDRMPDLVQAWTQRAGQLRLREKNVWLRVHPLGLSDSARATLGGSQQITDAIGLRSTALLEARISQALDIPVIPSATNGATRAAVLTLANLDARESFPVAEADYGVQVQVRELRQVVAADTGPNGTRRQGNAYGAALVVTLQKESLEPGGGPEVISRFQLRRIDTVYHYGERRVDSAQAFSRLIRSFHEDLGANLGTPSTDWIKASRSDQEPRSPSEITRAISDFSKRLK
jgi:hypothetical protein